MNENGQILKVLTEMLGQQNKMVTELIDIRGQQNQMLGQQKIMVAEMKGIKQVLNRHGEILIRHEDNFIETKRLLKRHEDILMHILEALEDDIPKYDELIEMENIKGNKIVLRKTK